LYPNLPVRDAVSNDVVSSLSGSKFFFKRPGTEIVVSWIVLGVFRLAIDVSFAQKHGSTGSEEKM